MKKNKNPKVSVLLATYNRAEFLGRAIESVQAQSFKDWEIIVADDGSSDDTPKIIKKWQEKEPRIVYLRSETNRGISKNYNSGFRVMRGEYAAMIDDDDYWCDKDKLAKQVKFLDENPEYVGCGGGVIVVDTSGRELYRYLKPEKDEEIRERMLFSNPMANSTTMFRLKAAREVGFYDETKLYASDRDFWLKMDLIGKLYNFPEYFSYYTMTGNNVSILNIRTHLRESFNFVRRYKNKYPHYFLAFLFNLVQYLYSFLPKFIRKRIHYFLARLKRRVVG